MKTVLIVVQGEHGEGFTVRGVFGSMSTRRARQFAQELPCPCGGPWVEEDLEPDERDGDVNVIYRASAGPDIVEVQRHEVQ